MQETATIKDRNKCARKQGRSCVYAVSFFALRRPKPNFVYMIND